MMARVSSPGSLTAMPSASVSPPIAPWPAFDDILHRRIELGLDADHLDVGLERLGGDRNAGNQPAAADRDDQRVEVRRVLEHFERDGPGAGDDLRIVERMDEDIAVFAASSSRALA